jgi:hypothetical protein
MSGNRAAPSKVGRDAMNSAKVWRASNSLFNAGRIYSTGQPDSGVEAITLRVRTAFRNAEKHMLTMRIGRLFHSRNF